MPRGKRSDKFPAVIVQHGFSGSFDSPVVRKICLHLEKNGFIALRFAFSGHKPSQGGYRRVLISQFIKDIKAAIAFLSRVDRVNRSSIGLIGHSLGAFTSLMAAGALAEQVKALVAVSGFYNLNAVSRSIKSNQPGQIIKKNNKKYWIISGLKVNNKFDKDPVYFKKRIFISKINCPALIIHGQRDNIVSSKDAYSIYRLIKQKKDLIIIKGADHHFTNKIHMRKMVNWSVKWLKKYL